MLFLLLIIHSICIAASQRLFSDQTYLNALVWEEMLTSLTSIQKKHGLCSSGEAWLLLFHFRLKEAQQTVQKITAEESGDEEDQRKQSGEKALRHSCAADYTHAVYVNNSITCVHTNTNNTNTWSETEDQLQ